MTFGRVILLAIINIDWVGEFLTGYGVLFRMFCILLFKYKFVVFRLIVFFFNRLFVNFINLCKN